jgi:hypothetical protein
LQFRNGEIDIVVGTDTTANALALPERFRH